MSESGVVDMTGYWGVCPECRRTDGYLNVGRGHWFYCREHRTLWYVGSNMFSSWRYQSEDEQRAIYAQVFGDGGEWRDVEPVYTTSATP